MNVGTPNAPTTGAVRRYLREFLSDPRVLDIPAPLRFLLLNAVILPFRPRRSAEAYKKIWTPAGSPLLEHSEALRAGLQTALGNDFVVELGMRYGEPNFQGALDRLGHEGVTELVLVPLYPQYAGSSTGTSLEAVFRQLAPTWNVATVRTLRPFYEDPLFLDAVTRVSRPVFDKAAVGHVLFSFHGLPERQIHRSDVTGTHCLASKTCCDVPVAANRFCYRFQAFQTARALAARLNLPPERWSVAFQSRLGRTPWIRPYTDEVVPSLAHAGVRRLGVLCPSFVADCLETLEEVGIRAREAFLAAGGETLALAPCVNGDGGGVEGLARWVRRSAGAGSG
jgi:ferrochelatase